MKLSKMPLMCVVFLISMAFVGVAGACTVGCTPGFWKNNPELWPAGIVPSATLIYQFDTNGNEINDSGDVPFDLNLIAGPDSNRQALSYRGGPGINGMRRNLLRAAVAAKLNSLAFGGDYPGTSANLDAAVISIVSSTDRANMEMLKNRLDGWNNLGCPLAAYQGTLEGARLRS